MPGLKHGHTVDGSEIPNNHLGCDRNPVNDGIKYQPQLVFFLAGFRTNHTTVLAFLKNRPMVALHQEG